VQRLAFFREAMKSDGIGLDGAMLWSPFALPYSIRIRPLNRLLADASAFRQETLETLGDLRNLLPKFRGILRLKGQMGPHTDFGGAFKIV
jgi:hypothetical protein